jgi:hypothetical protein
MVVIDIAVAALNKGKICQSDVALRSSNTDASNILM